ncbi:hypothetical protein [Mucilaginibacter antarcticus]|uniref:Uncharacterized protein n=1 Tax=Mucilaginibacter antarcticus TaxID=1855725 RepID=A0ABW5XL38_9SPHI
MDTKPNNNSANNQVVSDEDRRKLAEIIAKRPKSVSTNYSTGEVITVFKDGRVVKSRIAPMQPIITRIGDETEGVGKVTFNVRLDGEAI